MCERVTLRRERDDPAGVRKGFKGLPIRQRLQPSEGRLGYTGLPLSSICEFLNRQATPSTWEEGPVIRGIGLRRMTLSPMDGASLHCLTPGVATTSYPVGTPQSLQRRPSLCLVEAHPMIYFYPLTFYLPLCAHTVACTHTNKHTVQLLLVQTHTHTHTHTTYLAPHLPSREMPWIHSVSEVCWLWTVATILSSRLLAVLLATGAGSASPATPG